jgi:hypothetical protein
MNRGDKVEAIIQGRLVDMSDVTARIAVNCNCKRINGGTCPHFWAVVPSGLVYGSIHADYSEKIPKEEIEDNANK